jgi:hypothetical protein
MFQGSSDCWFAGEEARKKRTFFPEDVIDSNFHASLLFMFLESIVLSIAWSKLHDSRVKKKQNSSSTTGTKSSLRGTTQFVN